jgi:hypothetical protein
MLSGFGIVVVDILSYQRTAETVKESHCKNKTAYKTGVDFKHCTQVQHQETCNCLENQILGKVTRTETDSLSPTQFVVTVVYFVCHKNEFID